MRTAALDRRWSGQVGGEGGLYHQRGEATGLLPQYPTHTSSPTSEVGTKETSQPGIILLASLFRDLRFNFSRIALSCLLIISSSHTLSLFGTEQPLSSCPVFYSSGFPEGPTCWWWRQVWNPYASWLRSRLLGQAQAAGLERPSSSSS